MKLVRRWAQTRRPCYFVSDDGQVRSEDGRMIARRKDKDGYLVVTLGVGDCRSPEHVHVLVAEAFLGPRPKGAQVSHLDNDRLNNAVSNLRYESPRENAAHKKDPSFIPPVSVSKNAELGLKLREKFGRGGTSVGVRRAQQLWAREPLTIEAIKDINGFLARHGAQKVPRGWADKKNPSAQWIAWLLWGGDEARTWVRSILDRQPEP